MQNLGQRRIAVSYSSVVCNTCDVDNLCNGSSSRLQKSKHGKRQDASQVLSKWISPVSISLVSSARTSVSWRCMPCSRGRRGRRRTLPLVSRMRMAYHILICIPALRANHRVHINMSQLEQQHYTSCRADARVTCNKLCLCLQTTMYSHIAHSLRE